MAFLFFFKATYQIYRADICITRTLSCMGMFLWLAVICLLWVSLCLSWKAEGSEHLGTHSIPVQGAPRALGQGSPRVSWELLQLVGTDCGSVGLARGCKPRMCHCTLPASPAQPPPQPVGREAGQGGRAPGPVGTSAQGEPWAQVLPLPAAPIRL